MRLRLPLVLFALLTFAPAPPLLAAPADPPPAAAGKREAAPEACPAGANAQLAQLDCCKGHKGICGCRAGKIVCCDGTVSTDPNCTCHREDSFPN